MTITLLSPDRAKLERLAPKWEKECKKAGLIPGGKPAHSEVRGLERFGPIDIEQLAASPFSPDLGEPNGSSIAFLAEYAGKTALLAADAHADRLIESLKTLKKPGQPLRVDVFKVAHHGSERNTSRELLKMIHCRRFLLSTNGSYFRHPAPETISRIIKFGGRGATLYFNYRTQFTTVWNRPDWKAKYGYSVVYPERLLNGNLVLEV